MARTTPISRSASARTRRNSCAGQYPSGCACAGRPFEHGLDLVHIIAVHPLRMVGLSELLQVTQRLVDVILRPVRLACRHTGQYLVALFRSLLCHILAGGCRLRRPCFRRRVLAQADVADALLTDQLPGVFLRRRQQGCFCVLSPDAFTSALCSAAGTAPGRHYGQPHPPPAGWPPVLRVGILLKHRLVGACLDFLLHRPCIGQCAHQLIAGGPARQDFGKHIRMDAAALAVIPSDSSRSITSCGMSSIMSRLSRSMRAAEMPLRSCPCPASCSGSQLRMLEYWRSPRSSALKRSSSSAMSPLAVSRPGQVTSSVSTSTIAHPATGLRLLHAAPACRIAQIQPVPGSTPIA